MLCPSSVRITALSVPGGMGTTWRSEDTSGPGVVIGMCVLAFQELGLLHSIKLGLSDVRRATSVLSHDSQRFTWQAQQLLWLLLRTGTWCGEGQRVCV